MGSLVNISDSEDDWQRAEAVYLGGAQDGRDEPLKFVAHLLKVHADYCRECSTAGRLARKKADEILPQSETPTPCITPIPCDTAIYCEILRLDDTPAHEATIVHDKITYVDMDPMIDCDGAPMIDHHLEPMIDQESAPMIDHHRDPLIDHHLDPMIDHDGAPMIDHHMDSMIDQDSDPLIDHSYCNQSASCSAGNQIECTRFIKKDSVITKDVVRPVHLVKSLVTAATEHRTAHRRISFRTYLKSSKKTPKTPVTHSHMDGSDTTGIKSLLDENIPHVTSKGHLPLHNIIAIPTTEQKTRRAVDILPARVSAPALTYYSRQDEKQQNMFSKNTRKTPVTYSDMDDDKFEIKSLLDENIPPVPSTGHRPSQTILAIPNTEQKTHRAVEILPESVTAPALTEPLGKIFSNPSTQTFPTKAGNTTITDELALYTNFELFKLEPIGAQKCLLKRVVNQDMRAQFKNAYGNFIGSNTKICSENKIDETADVEQSDAEGAVSDVIINYSVDTEITASLPTTNDVDVDEIPLSEDVSHPVSCPYCFETFRHDLSFNKHLSLHINSPAYRDKIKCEVCGKAQPSRIALLQHMHVHTNFKLYSCTVCSKKFAYGKSFKDHMRIHSGRKNMKCSLCGEFFNTYYNLRHHRRTQHGLEKVICKKTQKICEYCGRQFRWRSALLSHYNIHTEIPKSHLCSVCGKGFANANSLAKHFGKHRKESQPQQPSVCKFCGSCFANRGRLYRHMKQLHNAMKS